MEVKAKLNYLRIAPRKTRVVIDLIRGLDAAKAVDQLNFCPRAAARPLLKLLQSAIANAQNNFHLKRENLYIKQIIADEGPKLKRFKPRAFGRAAEFFKRSSHITLILAEKKPTKNVQRHKAKEEKKEDLKILKHEEIKGESLRKETTEPEEKKTRRFLNFKSIKDRIIRKTGEK